MINGDENSDFHDVAMLFLQWLAVAATHTLNMVDAEFSIK
jgi:hypothetical protein